MVREINSLTTCVTLVYMRVRLVEIRIPLMSSAVFQTKITLIFVFQVGCDTWNFLKINQITIGQKILGVYFSNTMHFYNLMTEFDSIVDFAGLKIAILP